MDRTKMVNQHPSSKEKNMSYSFTWVKDETFKYKWIIHNFKLCLSKNILKSPVFYGGGQNLSWYLQFQILNQKHAEYLNLTLFLKECIETDLSANIKVSMLNNKGENVYIDETTQPQVFKPNGTMQNGQEWFSIDERHAHVFQPNDTMFYNVMTCNYNEFINEENGKLSFGTLTLFCEITVVDIVSKSGQMSPVPECCLSKDLENVFETQKFCDITLSVGGREFQAHKNILSGRSSVFAAMFGHEFAESKQNCVTINDVDHEVFEEILRFMYTGQSKKVESMANELLIAADKYALERLKVMCEEVLSNQISIDNVCDFLVMADRHNANQLKVQTMMFIKNNFAIVKSTVGWKNAKDSEPLLLVAIFERCFNETSLV